jgi:hypothetical protein
MYPRPWIQGLRDSWLDFSKRFTSIQPSKEELMRFVALVFESAKSLQKNTIAFEVPKTKCFWISLQEHNTNIKS